MGGGGGTQRTTGTTSPTYSPELSGALRSFGNMASNIFNTIGPDYLNFMTDQTPQQIAGPNAMMTDAYQYQSGMLNAQAPQAWSDAMGMYQNLGNLPAWGGVDLSGITGWGSNPSQTYQPQQQYSMFSAHPQAQGKMAANQSFDTSGWGDGGRMEANVSEPPTGGGGVAGDNGQNPGTNLEAWRAASLGLDPSQAGGSAAAGNPNEPGGATGPNYVQGNPYAGGVNAPGLGRGPGTGTVGGPEDYMKGWGRGGGGGGGGGGSFSFSAGGGDIDMLEREANPLQNIDFANHPALKSALDTFSKTTLPGIENAMIGAGLGRSGAAGNAIATGKAQMALPVMQQLMDLEMQNKGLDVTQRGQDYQAKIAAQQAAASAASAGASLQAQRYAADLAYAQATRGQDVALRQMDINALMGQGEQALAARNMDINALLGGAGGLMQLGGSDLDRINTNIGNAWQMGGGMRDLQQAEYDSQFNAANRPWERMNQFMGPLMQQMSQPGTATSQVQTGGGGK